MDELSININCKKTISEFKTINRFVKNTNSDDDIEILRSLLKDIHDRVYNKATFLEALGNNFVESLEG